MATICSRWCGTWWHICYEWLHLCMLQSQLKTKKPKMPDQSCANGLQLHGIPHDLQNIFPLERRVISPWIPFIIILVMWWYGGHYKVNGPPVNVPATLDQIIEMLPHMPSELQLHPVKLKHKLEYKSHYMYDMICRDHVISAFTWLKEYNSHYTDIKLNEHWYNDIAAKNCQSSLMKMIIVSQLLRMQFFTSHCKRKILAKTNWTKKTINNYSPNK